MAVALIDAEASLVYFNPATERLLGLEQAAMGEIRYRELQELLDYRHADGSPMKYEERPLWIALYERRPHQTTIIMHDAGGVPHLFEVTAIPLEGQGGELIGAMSIFWEADGAPIPEMPF